MRIDLVTPFAEKDAVKALGARWDAAKKTWYVQNAADLTPFRRWLPARVALPEADTARASSRLPATAPTAPSAPSDKGTVTQSAVVLAHCGCDVLPWEPCTHHS